MMILFSIIFVVLVVVVVDYGTAVLKEVLEE